MEPIEHQLVQPAGGADTPKPPSPAPATPHAPRPSRRRSPQQAAGANGETAAETKDMPWTDAVAPPHPVQLPPQSQTTAPPARPGSAPNTLRRKGRVTAPVPGFMYPYPVDSQGRRVATPAHPKDTTAFPAIQPVDTMATATATAKELRQQARVQRANAKSAAAAAAKKRLGGLPAELFDDVHDKVSNRTGISFLRIMSLKL